MVCTVPPIRGEIRAIQTKRNRQIADREMAIGTNPSPEPRIAPERISINE